jgi:hypothetical protein
MQFRLNDRGIVKARDFDEQVIDLFDDAEPFERKREKMALYTDVIAPPTKYCAS